MTVTSPEAPRRPAPKPVDREKLQRRAVWLMFSFVVLTLAAVTVFRLSGAEPIAQPPTTAIAAERLVLLERPERNGPVFVRDAETGRLMARSDRNKNGFIDVIGRVVDRQRLVDGTDPEAPLRVVRFDSGRISLIDVDSGRRIEITGHGSENVAAFARLLDR
jgi:putative photosynthetic complex assembly protein